MFDFVSPYLFAHLVYLTRSRQNVIYYSHIVRPFNLNVWIFVIFTLLLLATMKLIAYHMYQKPHLKSHNLVKLHEPWFNFYLFSFFKITEPESLPWFTKWCTGKFLMALWMILSQFLIFFYMSSLRVHFMTAKYEDPPSTLKHIVLRQQRVYLVDIAVDLR